MFIIVSLMTFPVGFAGIFIWPGTPAMPNKLFLSADELTLARQRLEDADHSGPEGKGLKPSWTLIRSILTDPKTYILTIWDALFWNASPAVFGNFLLWLNSLNRYSTSRVNSIGSLAPGLGMLWILVVNFSSDLILGPPGAITMALLVNIVVCVILAIWNVPESAKWFAFSMSYFELGMSSVLYGWTNDILRHDNQKRAMMLIIMNAVAQSTTGWTPLFTWKTVDAPQFRIGYTYVAVISVVLIMFTWLVWFLHRRQESVFHLKSECCNLTDHFMQETVCPREIRAAKCA